MPRLQEPKKNEPIRLIAKKSGGHSYVAVLDIAATGQARRQVAKRFHDLSEARRWINETRASLDRGTYVPPSRITFRQLSDKWLADKDADAESGGIRQVTVNGYRSALDAPLRHIGDEVAQELTPTDIRKLLRTLATIGGKWERPLSHRTIVYALGAIRQVFAFGVENGLLQRNPCDGVKPPRKKQGDKKEIVIWTPAELATFRDHIDTYGSGESFAAEPWIRAAFRLSLCGLRRSEVLGLGWECVDLKDGTVRVEKGRVKIGTSNISVLDDAKSDASLRTVRVETIHEGTKAALRDLWIAQGQPESGLVVCDALGLPLQPDAYSRRFRALCEEAALPDLGSIHNLRHSVATALHNNGVSPQKAASLLGHTVATHIAFYLPTTDEGAAEAAVVAGQIFAASVAVGAGVTPR